jgi:hypothetical protein
MNTVGEIIYWLSPCWNSTEQLVKPQEYKHTIVRQVGRSEVCWLKKHRKWKFVFHFISSFEQEQLLQKDMYFVSDIITQPNYVKG